MWAEWDSKKGQGDAEEIMEVLQACEVKLKQMEDWTAHQKQQQQQSMVYLQQVHLRQATTAHLLLLSLQLYEKEQAFQGQRSDNDLKLGIAQEMDASSLWLPQEDLYEDVRVLFSHQAVAKEYRSLFTPQHRLNFESQHRKREELDQVVRLLMDIAAQREAVASMEEHLQAVKMQGQLTSMLIAMANGE